MSNSLYTAMQQAKPSGAVGNAMDIKRLKPLYDEYSIEKQSNGETAMPFEDWIKSANPLSKLSK